jgi:hypothetical protein
MLLHLCLQTERQTDYIHNIKPYFDQRKKIQNCNSYFRWLATGDSLETISFSYRLVMAHLPNRNGHVQTYTRKTDAWGEATTTEERWKETASEFYGLWNFPNCLGHWTASMWPSSSYSNYKETLSDVLKLFLTPTTTFQQQTLVSIGKTAIEEFWCTRSGLVRTWSRDRHLVQLIPFVSCSRHVVLLHNTRTTTPRLCIFRKSITIHQCTTLLQVPLASIPPHKFVPPLCWYYRL